MTVATETTAPPATAGAMLAMLRRHYLPAGRPPSGLFAPEIGSPCGRRRADLIWMPTAVSSGRGLVGHEVKVTRSDVLAELADPMKADPWARCCTRWWLVVADPALVEGLDIPEAWGVMAPPSGRRTRSMTILRPAPALKPGADAVAEGLAKLVTWEMYRHIDAQAKLTHQVDYWKREAETERQRALNAEAHRDTGGSPHGRKVSKILGDVHARLRDENVWADVDESVVVDAIVDALATRQAADATRRELDRVIREVENILDPFKFAARELKRAAAAAKAGAR